MNEEIEVLKQYIEMLGLDKKSSLTTDDINNLSNSLYEADEFVLSNYITNLKNPSELEDLLTNILYAEE